MIDSKQLTILKRVTSIADNLQIFGAMNLLDYGIFVNDCYALHESAIEGLRILQIPHKGWVSKLGVKDNLKLDVRFGCFVDLQTIYCFTFFIKELACSDSDKVEIRIIYSKEDTSSIYLGFPETGSTFTTYALSRTIKVDEILSIKNIQNMSWQEFEILFPNLNPMLKDSLSYRDTSIPDFINRMESELGELKRSESQNFSSYYDESDLNPKYENTEESKYGGYNGFSDNTINEAFEGDPENTWNVD